MVLKKREKILAAVTASLLVLFVGRFLVSAWRGPANRLRADRDKKRTEVDVKQKRLAKGQQAEQRLAELNRRSLPSDPETARSLYQGWLFALSEEAGFDGTKVETSEGRARGNIYHGLHFSVNAEASLDQLTEFLHKFYSAGHLHRIRNLKIQPTAKGQNLELVFSIEALSLPGADRQDKLSGVASDRLAAADLEEYRKAIGGRNLFAAYEPPRPELPKTGGPPEPPKFDPTKYAYLTGIVNGVDNEPEVWLLARTSGKTQKLHKGDTFEVGELKGKILHINRRDAEVEIDGQRWLFPIGDNLHEVRKLSEEAKQPPVEGEGPPASSEVGRTDGPGSQAASVAASDREPPGEILEPPQ